MTGGNGGTQMRRVSILTLAMAVVTALGGCAGSERDITLKDIRSFSGGPDEFLVLPAKPLEQPPSFTALPPPTPGGANLTDQNPQADAVAALGGRPDRLRDTGIAAQDTALVAAASRNGVTADIRQTLATEDAEFRRQKSRFTKIRLVRVDRYNQAYSNEALKPYAEMSRWRQAGALTPAAPPSQN